MRGIGCRSYSDAGKSLELWDTPACRLWEDRDSAPTANSAPATQQLLKTIG